MSEQSEGQTQLTLPGFESAMQGATNIMEQTARIREAHMEKALKNARGTAPHLNWSGRVLKNGHIELTVHF